jgi:hypothetical protein
VEEETVEHTTAPPLFSCEIRDVSGQIQVERSAFLPDAIPNEF